MPKVSFTPCATSVSTNASLGVMRTLPAAAEVLAMFLLSTTMFMEPPFLAFPWGLAGPCHPGAGGGTEGSCGLPRALAGSFPMVGSPAGCLYPLPRRSFAWIAAVILLAGFVQGALGIGFPTLATPLIALVTDIRTAVIIVLLPCLASIVVAIAGGGPLRRVLAEFWMMPLYMLIGAAIGTRFFIAYPGFPYTLLLAGVILVYLSLDRLGRTDWPLVRDHKGPAGLLFGVIAGISEGTANVAAPPLIVYYLAIGLDPTMFVQALNICFLVGKSTQFVTLTTAGASRPCNGSGTLPLALVAGAGALYGIRIRNRIDAATYRQWLKGALFAIALVLIGHYLYRL